MKKKKTFKNNHFLYIFPILILIIITLLYLHSFSSHIKESVENNNIYTYITPTIIPSVNNGWNTFLHPRGDFDFNYPSNWNITVEKHKNTEDWYNVLLSGRYKDNDFMIYFLINGGDGLRYDYEKNEEKFIGNKKILWTTMYKNTKAFGEIISFPNNDFKEKLIGIYIKMPENNQEEFNEIIKEIVASLHE